MQYDQTTLIHIAIGAAAAFLIIKYLGWRKPEKAKAGPTYVLGTGGESADATKTVVFDIPNLPLKAVVTLQPKDAPK